MDKNSFIFFHNLQSIESSRVKKNAIIDESGPLVLNLKIHCAVDIDNPSLYPSVKRRRYFVRFWVDPNERLTTREVEGWIYPRWNHMRRILLGDGSDNYDFLYVEVVRRGSSDEPETSGCSKVVGRAKIPLPNELNCEKVGTFGLVRMKEGKVKGEGFIALTMLIQRLDPRFLFC